jgi:hypothetical protein
MEKEFSELNADQRTARCLELAQLALGRVEASQSVEQRELNLNLARCWHSLAEQFGTIVILRARAGLDAPSPQAAADRVPEATPQEALPDLRFSAFAPAA